MHKRKNKSNINIFSIKKYFLSPEDTKRNSKEDPSGRRKIISFGDMELGNVEY
jgi:hypothetical protein